MSLNCRPSSRHGVWRRLLEQWLPVWLAMFFLSAGQARLNAEPAPPDPAALEYFESHVRPLLVANCYACHGPDQQKGGLRLDSAAAVLAGGDSGPAVLPGQPDQSLLIDAVRYGQVFKMPPKGKLSEADVNVLVTWVKRGAVWPAAPDIPPATMAEGGPLFTDEQKAFWAFQPPQEPTLPSVSQVAWPQSPLDYFILAGLEQAGLSPAPPAEKRALIRRATFDLIGLPPLNKDVEAFLDDNSPEAFARVVDRLLASPMYGERWGRHWLDVARYADSNGLDENLAYVNAYRYRDYVVSAFNQDKPYDEFVREQIAGDLLPSSGRVDLDQARMIATGFLTLGAKMLAEDDPVKMEMDIIDEQVDSLGGALLGLTFGCARCHDHKFDPIPQADYYSLAGIFKSTKTMENFSVVAVWHERPLATQEHLAMVDAHRRQVADARAALEARQRQVQDAFLAVARAHAAEYLMTAAELEPLDLAGQSWLARPEGAPGALVVEAEMFARGNVKVDFEAYGVGVGVIYNQGELPNYAEYDVQVPSAGLWQVELRYAAASPRPVKLLVDGVLVRADAAGQQTGTWQPDTQTWFAESVCWLDAGAHTLRLERSEPFPHFDRVAFVPRELPADMDGRAFALTPISSEAQGSRVLNRAILEQWIKYVARAKSDPQSACYPYYVWRMGAEPATAIAAGPEATALIKATLRAPLPQTGAELRERFAEQFSAADTAWNEMKAATPTAERLDDPGLEVARQLLYDPAGPLGAPTDMERYLTPDVVAELASGRQGLATLEQSAPPAPDQAMAVSEREVANLRIHIRGNHLTLGEEAPRRFPRILAGEEQGPLPATQSGRLELANWLTRPDHPLTARVMANRVWRGHFGAGIVRSTDNFGQLGERPSNPALLDWLARRFVDDGWSLKALHRRIMLSATYQMSSAHNPQAAQVDPDNRLHWRANRRRLEAEAIRDSILAVSGRLELTQRGTLLRSKPREYVASTTSVNTANYDTQRRSLYLPVVRSALYEVLQAFDFAEPSVLNGDRATTTVAPQALFMMNGQIVLDETRHLAHELLARSDLDDAARVQLAYQRVYCRDASEPEQARSLDFVRRYDQALPAELTDAAERRLRVWQGLCRVLLAANEFIFVE